QQLLGRDALRLQLGDRGGRVEAFLRDAVERGQRRVGVGRAGLVPGAEVVVRHHVVPVEVLRGAPVVGGVDLAAVGAVRGDGGGDQVVVAELGAQGLGEGPEGRRAAGVTGQTAGVGVLPVDVDAVEDIGPARVLHHGLAGLGEGDRVLRGLAEADGVGPAAEGGQHLDVRVLGLQLAQLVEVAAQRLVPGVGLAADGLVGGVGLVGCGVGVVQLALAVHHVAEGVVDVGDLGGRAGRHQVLDVVVAAVDAPLGEVAEVDLVAGGRRFLGLAGGADLHGAADRAGLVGGVPGLHGVGVVGALAEPGVRVGGAGHGGDLGAVAEHVVVLDALVVGRGRPGQLHRGVGDVRGGGGAGCGGRLVAGDAAAVAAAAVELAAGGGAGAAAVEAEGDGRPGGEGAVPAEVLGGPV